MKLLLSLATVFLALDTGAYATLKASAKTLERPASAIAALVGACDVGGGAVSGECLENTKDLKDSLRNKRVSIDLGSGHEAMLAFGGRQDSSTVRFVWAPLYDVRNGLALTVGKPQKLSANGNVVMAKRPIDGAIVGDFIDGDLRRLASTGQLGIEIVGQFGATWTLGGGEKPVKGVQFQVEGLRLYHARTGQTVFESLQAFK